MATRTILRTAGIGLALALFSSAPAHPQKKLPDRAQVKANTPEESHNVLQRIAGSLAKHEPVPELVSPEIADSVLVRLADVAAVDERGQREARGVLEAIKASYQVVLPADLARKAP